MIVRISGCVTAVFFAGGASTAWDPSNSLISVCANLKLGGEEEQPVLGSTELSERDKRRVSAGLHICWFMWLWSSKHQSGSLYTVSVGLICHCFYFGRLKAQSRHTTTARDIAIAPQEETDYKV